MLRPSGIVLTAKQATPVLREPELGEQLREDVAYYQQQRNCRTLVGLIYDPEAILVGPRQLEITWASFADELRVRPVIAS
jgi:hypothetical protein